jgi:hypothetical protein
MEGDKAHSGFSNRKSNFIVGSGWDQNDWKIKSFLQKQF